ncbi:MAG: hypothetical protein ACOCYQ_02950 [Alkalispirochaeta sp.]
MLKGIQIPEVDGFEATRRPVQGELPLRAAQAPEVTSTLKETEGPRR